MKITQPMPLVITTDEARQDPQLASMCAPVTNRTLALTMDARTPIVINADRYHHPKRLPYRFHALTRALAHSLDHPNSPLSVWSAAALYGFGRFSDGADSCLLRAGRSQSARTVWEPTWQRLRGNVEIFELTWAQRTLFAVSPEYALVRCAQEVMSGKRKWDVPRVPGLLPELVRTVQLVDAYRFAGFPLEPLAEVARGKLDGRVFARVLKLSDDGAESPRETVLRLILGQITGLDLESQVLVSENGRPITRFDLADRGRKIGFMYDGAHHGGGDQWAKDAEINFRLSLLGWKVIRIVSKMLNDPEQLQAQVAEAL